MTALNEEGLKTKAIWRYLTRFMIVLFLMYFLPIAKHNLFPGQIVRLEKMLRGTTMVRYNLAIDRKKETKMILTVYDGGRSITTEIYRDALLELTPAGNSRIFSAHSINRDAEGEYYLTWTRIEADAHLSRVRRLEVKVCDRLVGKDGQVRFNGPEPIIECAVPIQEAVCLAAE